MAAGQRVTALALFRVQNFKFHPHAFRHGLKVVIAVEMVLRRRQPQSASAMMIVDRIIWIFCHLFVEIDRMGLQTNHRLIRTKIRHLRSRMPGGAGRQFISLHQHAIGDALLRKMIECRTTANTTTYDDNLCVRFHDLSPDEILDSGDLFGSWFQVRLRPLELISDNGKIHFEKSWHT